MVRINAKQLPQMGPNGQRPDLIIRNSTMITMDDAQGVVEGADIHIVAGRIAAIGKTLVAPGALEINAEGMIAMPGMIETHTHVWNTLHRNMSGKYFTLSRGIGPHYRPTDSYNSVRLAATEALSSGLTTLLNYAHNNTSLEHTVAEIEAMSDSGIRTRYAYGWHQTIRTDELIDLDAMRTAYEQWHGKDDGRIEVGFGARDDFELCPGHPAAAAEPRILQVEWAAARELGMSVIYHAGDSPEGGASVVEQVKRGYIADGVLLAHGYYFDDAGMKLIHEQGASMSTCPLFSMVSYNVLAPVQRYIDSGIPTCFSFDHMFASGSYDMFRVMYAAVAVEGMLQQKPYALPPLSALRATTIDAARAMRIDHLVGSLVVGKQADIVLLDRQFNMSPLVDPVKAVVYAGSPANVDTVIVDGRVLKLDGEMLGVDTRAVREAAQDSTRYLVDKSGYPNVPEPNYGH